MNEKIKNVFEPSEKVHKMYEAITAFVEEKRDLSSIKVSEITSRAGIGKGTAYEYFSSKEELIIHATMWMCSKQMNRIVEESDRLEGFENKFFFLLEWFQEHRAYNEMLLKAMKGSFQGDCGKIKSFVSEDVMEQLKGYIADQLNRLMELGYQEGIFTEQNVEKRIIIFAGALMQYGFGSMNREEGAGLQMSDEELRKFTYECMVKALN